MDILEFKKNTNSYLQRHPWEIARTKIIKYLIKKQKKKFNHLLDIGSGDAYLLNELCKIKIADNYTAVDTSYESEIIEKISANNEDNINFLNKLPDALIPLPDCILMLDVIEHCPDDNAVVKESISIARTEKFSLLITVPAFQSLFSKHDELLQHYRRYTIMQLKQLCNKNKLQVTEGGYFFFSLFVIRSIQVFLEKMMLRKPEHTIDNWRESKRLTSFYTSLLWIDFKICFLLNKIGIRLPGLSAYCLCRPLP